MKITRLLSRSLQLCTLGLLGLAASHASAQTVITSVPYTINASGKYKLGGNLNNNTINIPAITVNAPNVILDLDGFFVAGPGNTALAGSANSVILVGNFANVTIKNGTVAGAPYGIYYAATNPAATSRNYIVDTVTVTRCYFAGVYFSTVSAPGSLIKNCAFSNIGNSTYNVDTFPSAIYTNGQVRMENNNIASLTATGAGYSIGINGFDGDFAIGNTISNCDTGISLVSKFLNNLTFNVATPFDGGGNAIGND